MPMLGDLAIPKIGGLDRVGKREKRHGNGLTKMPSVTDKPDQAIFGLEDWQVPDPPKCLHWPCALRWLVMVMDPDDPQLAFAASLLSHAIRRPGLTEKQAIAANRMLARIHLRWREGSLDCLNTSAAPAVTERSAGDLEDVEPAGHG